MRDRDYTKQPKEFDEKIIQLKRVSKKTKGGNKIGFTALVVVGNRKGKVGYGLGKAKTVSEAIQKALTKARDNTVEITITGASIAHDIRMKFKGASIFMKPAPAGAGIIAGGAIRDVMDLVGIKDVSAKMLGSSNKEINIHCALNALQALRK
ncbi:30S ribosomal protein S5 [candidate division WWE3 bacterium]|nr:30S ribosomal protein S5 [candidate division WWE3 bacterium]